MLTRESYELNETWLGFLWKFLQVSREHIGKRFWKGFCTAHFTILQFQRYWILESFSQTNKISCVNSCLKKRSACERSSSCRSEILCAWTVWACSCNGADLNPLTHSLPTDSLSRACTHIQLANAQEENQRFQMKNHLLQDHVHNKTQVVMCVLRWNDCVYLKMLSDTCCISLSDFVNTKTLSTQTHFL